MKRAQHFEAAMAAIPAPVAAHDTKVPIDPVTDKVIRASYVVVYDLGADDPPSNVRLTETQRSDASITWRYRARSVGITPFAARSVDSAVADGMVGKRVVVAGRSCWPIRLDVVGEVVEDKDVSPPLYFVDSEYLLRSDPA